MKESSQFALMNNDSDCIHLLTPGCPPSLSFFVSACHSAAVAIVSDIADQANDSLKHGVSFKCRLMHQLFNALPSNTILAPLFFALSLCHLFVSLVSGELVASGQHRVQCSWPEEPAAAWQGER